jgi:uncharacterized membrane protein
MKRSVLVTLLVGVLLAGFATAGEHEDGAVPDIEWVKINGDKFDFADGDEVLRIERGDTLDIRVKLHASENIEDVEIAADILGYEYNDFARISDSTALFDMDADDTEVKELTLIMPANADKDKYDLRIRVAGRTGPSNEQRVALKLVGARHQVNIKDVILSPSNSVQAGRALLATVRVKNYGEQDEDGVKITVDIPALGVSASDYIDELEEDESTTSEELYLRVPNCAEAGLYDVVVTVEFDEGYERDTASTGILVTEGELCKPVGEDTEPTAPSTPQTVISVGATSQDVAMGAGGVVYPVTITNAGKSSKTYTMSVEGADSFADVSISPSSTMVVNGGETKSAFVFLTAKSTAAEGQRMFTLTVSSGGEVLQQIPLTANVVRGQQTFGAFPWERVKRGLEIGLVVLVILLVILGLIIGFNKLKGNEQGSDNKTYY